MTEANLIHDFLTITAQQTPDKPFLICGDKSYSFAQIDTESTTLAHQLCALGVAPNDKVAILMDNSAETVTALYGASKSAATFIVINSTVKAAKLTHILNNSEAKILITHTSKGRVVQKAVNNCLKRPTIIWDSPSGTIPPALQEVSTSYAWNDMITHRPGGILTPLPRANPDDLAALVYTSGSTGDPKGVMQPHNKMIAVAKNIILYLENDQNDVILNVLSLAFGYGMYQVLMSAMFGGTVVLEKSFIYLHDTLQKIAQHNVTALPVVPTVLAMMLKAQNLNDYDFSSLKYITNAGDALPTHHTSAIRQQLPDVRIYPMYGLTECVRVSYLPPHLIDEHPDSVGCEIHNCTALIVDEDGNPAPPDQVGELVITGDNVMDGYYNDSDYTSQIFRTADCGRTRLYTGDLFRRDENGLLFFVSRKNDIIKTRGERVSPREVERYLMDIDGVAEAVAIGVPDDIFGEVIKAYIVPVADHNLTDEIILKNATATMENYMIPKTVEFLDALPKTPNGKVNRKEMKKWNT